MQDYDDLESRLSLIESCGVDSIVTAHFEVADLHGSAERFLTLVNECVDLRELWLGATQSLGVGSEGSMSTIKRLSDHLGFRLVVMPPHREAINAGRVWDCLAAGRIEVATELVGHAPIRSRPQSGWLPLPWPRGTYPAIPLEKPIAVFSRVPADRINVEVTGNAASRGMLWPAKNVEWLAFVGDPILAQMPVWRGPRRPSLRLPPRT